MIIAGVGCFCIPVSFPWRLFDLSLITFKHHKAFDCFPPIYLSYSKPSSIKLPSVSHPHVCPRLASFPLYVCIFLYVSCSCDSKKSRPHTFVYIIAVFASFFFLFFIQVISAKAQWGIETNRKKYIKRRQNVPTDWECLTAMEKGKCRDADSFGLAFDNTRVSSSNCDVEDEQLKCIAIMSWTTRGHVRTRF